MKTEFYKEAFSGYDVPETIKKVAVNICDRFAINGICDPMHICNVIAKESGSGDGQGNFNSDTISNVEVIAKRIQGSYGCNIAKEEIPEIEYCLICGCFDKEKAVAGLGIYTDKIKKEMEICDDWRVDYLNRVLSAVSESVSLYR